MKPTTKATTQTPPGAVAPSPLDVERLTQARERFRKEMPSPSELSALAARIAGSHSFDRAGAHTIARQSLILWEACKNHLGSEIESRAKQEISVIKAQASRAKIKRPRAFPASLKDFLCRVVGGKDESTQLSKYRDYLYDTIRLNKAILSNNHDIDAVPSTTLDEVNAALERGKREGFPEDAYYSAAGDYLRWHAGKIAEVRRKAAKSPKKRKARPPLDKLKAAIQGASS